jgi:hypothetical protein
MRVPGEAAVVSTEKLARGVTNDLILPVQYLVLDAILDVLCKCALLLIFSQKKFSGDREVYTCMRR